MKLLTLLLFLLSSQLLSAQNQRIENKQMYWVTLSDKTDTIADVRDLLSERALQRRAQHGVAPDSMDIPVSAEYQRAVRETGAEIHHRSRWFNALTVVADTATLQALSALSFVDSIRYIGPHWEVEPESTVEVNERLKPSKQSKKDDDYYGFGNRQIEMINGQYLHEKGFRGEGIWVAVFDGGFTRVDQLEVFDSLRQREQILYTYDFVDGNNYVYQSSGHGTQVLSAMAANQPGILVGTAPDASYLLFKTENTRGEYVQEEMHWIAALEYADSAGVDLVNSSLGYNIFNDSNMNYRLEDITGLVSFSSRAADIAFQKGMIVVNAAGNEGNSDWKKVTIPADSRTMLSVGAVDANEQLASFSSTGPTSDGRLKPEISAMGARTAVVSPYSGNISGANGTSFSAPVITGMLASLWSAFPEKTNAEILEALFQSASQYEQPDNLLGYGIPDFMRAFELLGEVE